MTFSTVPLGELFEIARGGSPRPIADYLTDAEDGVNWVSISDATDSQKYIRQTKRRIKPEGVSRSRLVQPGDFLLTNSMSFGRPYIMATTGCIHDGWLALSPRSRKTDPDYVFQVLSSGETYRKFERLAAGATVKNLNIDLVRRVEIPLPPLAEQQRIAAILDQADALRRVRQQSVVRVRGLKSAMFYRMFGDPFAAGGTATVPLRSLTSRITYGFTSPLSHHENGVPILTAKNIREGEIDYSTCRYASEDQVSALTDKCKPRVGDILVTKDGTIGRWAVFNGPREVCINQSVALIRVQSDKSLPSYIASYIGLPSVQTKIQSMGKGNAIRHLQITEFAEFPVPVASMSAQLELKDRLTSIASLEEKVTKGLRRLDALFTSLQQRAFRGEL